MPQVVGCGTSHKSQGYAQRLGTRRAFCSVCHMVAAFMADPEFTFPVLARHAYALASALRIAAVAVNTIGRPTRERSPRFTTVESAPADQR